jgi:hypothetical protein
MSLALVACEDQDENGEIVCLAVVTPSAIVSVIDTEGETIEDPTIQVRIEGEIEDCEIMTTNEYMCGSDIPGEMTILVDAEGYDAQEIDIDVSESECGVISEELEVTLEPVTCTEQVVPSILITVVDDITAEPVADVEVFYAPEGEHWFAPEPCDLHGGTFYCGYEQAGNIDITVEAPNYLSYSDRVFVPADECHVITQDLEVPLESMLD